MCLLHDILGMMFQSLFNLNPKNASNLTITPEYFVCSPKQSEVNGVNRVPDIFGSKNILPSIFVCVVFFLLLGLTSNRYSN